MYVCPRASDNVMYSEGPGTGLKKFLGRGSDLVENRLKVRSISIIRYILS